MKCTEAKLLFSPYLDGSVTGAEMLALDRHTKECESCHAHFASLRGTQELLAKAARRKAPVDLPLKLKLAISHEAARSRGAALDGIFVRLQNAFQAYMVPAAAGLVTTIAVFGILLSWLVTPMRLQANNDDVPLLFYTAPQLQQSAFGNLADVIKDDSLVIEASVDASGRVQDYRVLSAPGDSKELLPEVKNMLIFTTFRPATAMGRPTTGKTVLSFSKISVRG